MSEINYTEKVKLLCDFELAYYQEFLIQRAMAHDVKPEYEAAWLAVEDEIVERNRRVQDDEFIQI